MLRSKPALREFQEWFDNLKSEFPVTKKGVVRSNCTRKNKEKMENSYLDFVYHLVNTYVRKVNETTENVDITQLYIPPDLLEEINTLYGSVEPMMIFYTPADIANYPDELDDKMVVVFGNEIIVPRRRI